MDKGMTDGQKIVFAGEGDQEPELEPGDIIIVLDEKEHDVSNQERQYVRPVFFFLMTFIHSLSKKSSY